MLRIRLQRPFNDTVSGYHIIVSNNVSSRDGKFIEKLGTIHTKSPGSKTKEEKGYTLLRLNHERTFYWLKRGAQPTKRLRKLFKFL